MGPLCHTENATIGPLCHDFSLLHNNFHNSILSITRWSPWQYSPHDNILPMAAFSL